MNPVILLRRSSRALSAALAAALLALGLSAYARRTLPPPEAILPVLQTEPEQNSTGDSDFTFRYGGADYSMRPRADYSIYGLVVSQNNISAFDDIYHDSSSVDVKDLCLVWGANVSDDVYRRVKFWSEPWSCHFQALSHEDYEEFTKDQLSNNHLLPADDAVKRAIQRVENGDQVLVSGKLIDYCRADTPEYVRRTSLTRRDTGNGACEVLFTTEVTVLKKGSAWNLVYHRAKPVVFILLSLRLVLALFGPYLEYKLRR